MLSHETYGRLGKPAMDFLNQLADIAERRGDVRRADFMEWSLRRLSVALYKGNARVLLDGLQTFARCSGTAVVHACTHTFAD